MNSIKTVSLCGSPGKFRGGYEMKKVFIPLMVLFFLSLAGGGCRTTSSVVKVDHKEVLDFPLPFDLVYLRTIEAINEDPDWELDFTDKEKGYIVLHNQNFSSFDDADLRTAKLIVKRLAYQRTTVELAPESRGVSGGDTILGLIKKHLTFEVERRQRAQ